MSGYLARLRELEAEKGAGRAPAKPAEVPFDPFAGEQPPRILRHIVDLRCPAGWTDGLAVLEALPIPRGVDGARWLAMLANGKRFASEWGGKANALDWSAAELFGLDPVAPLHRLDRRGAAFFLIDGEVVAITRELIKLNVGGANQSLHRRSGFTVPAWENAW